MTATPNKEQTPAPPGSTTSVKETMDLVQDLAPAPALPPGVYFCPTKMESVLTYLNRWIAGDAMPDAAGLIIEADVYAETPDVLARKYRPASTRDAEPSWWFLCHCKLQPTRAGGRSRCQRRVATGGYWKVEQKTKDIKCAVTHQILGCQRSFGYYVEEAERPKTWWLMEEYTSAAVPEDGVARDDGTRVLPALCRMYLTTRDPDDKKDKNPNKKKKRARPYYDHGEDGDEDGAPMPKMATRIVVPMACFDATDKWLSQSSAQGVMQEAPPSPLPGGFDPYQRYDAASPVDDRTMPKEEKGQGNTDHGESPQHRDLIPAKEEIAVWQMGRADAFADSSWIDEHY